MNVLVISWKTQLNDKQLPVLFTVFHVFVDFKIVLLFVNGHCKNQMVFLTSMCYM